MSAEKGEPLSRKQVAKLGGYGAAAKMTPQQRSERSRKGGEALKASRGRDYYVRLGLRRHGKKVALPGPKDSAKSEMEKSQISGADPGTGE